MMILVSKTIFCRSGCLRVSDGATPLLLAIFTLSITTTQKLVNCGTNYDSKIVWCLEPYFDEGNCVLSACATC